MSVSISHLGSYEPGSDTLGDKAMTIAAIHRLVHRAHRLELKGASMRKKQAASPASLTDAAAE